MRFLIFHPLVYIYPLSGGLVTDYRRSLLTKNTSDSLTDRLEFSSESVYPVVTAHAVQNQALPGTSSTKHLAVLSRVLTVLAVLGLCSAEYSQFYAQEYCR